MSMQGCIETQTSGEVPRTSERVRTAKDVRLSTFSQSGFRELFDCLRLTLSSRSHLIGRFVRELDTYVFMPILVNSKVDSPKRATPDLLLNDILVDEVLRLAIVLAVRECARRTTTVSPRVLENSQRLWSEGGRPKSPEPARAAALVRHASA